MVGMLLGNVINIILDPVFILGLDMGCAGAAVATSIGQIAAGVFFVVYILRGKTELSIRPKDFSAKDGIAKQVFAIGFPAAMITALMNIYTIITNAVMGHFGDLAVAAMGVAMKVAIIGSSVSNGIGQGIQPLIGYQVGKKDQKRFRETVRFSTVFALIISLARNGYVGIVAVLLMSLFGNIYAVVAAQPVSDLISIAITLVAFYSSAKLCFVGANFTGL